MGLSTLLTLLKNNIEVYLDYIGILFKTWKEHLVLLKKVSSCLKAHDITFNQSKSEWTTQETDWFGYCLTPTGLNPWKKCIFTLHYQNPLLNINELWSFLGVVYTYWLMWSRQACWWNLKSGKKNLHWNPSIGKVFKMMNTIFDSDVLMAYPNHNILFHVSINASDNQMGAVIWNYPTKWPVMYWSWNCLKHSRINKLWRKNSSPLSIIMVLKEAPSILLGAELYSPHFLIYVTLIAAIFTWAVDCASITKAKSHCCFCPFGLHC